MAKRTLANKKLTPEFADRIELQEFTDLNRLTDEELKAVVTRSRKKLTLVHALSENDPDTETLRNRVRDQFSKEDREKVPSGLHLRDHARPKEPSRSNAFATWPNSLISKFNR